MQELLRLQQQIYPSSVVINMFGMSEENGGHQIYCATLPYLHLLNLNNNNDVDDGIEQQQHKKIDEDDIQTLTSSKSIPNNSSRIIIDPKDPKLLSKLINDVVSDLNFLTKELGMRDIVQTLGWSNVGYFPDNNTFILTNWAKVYEKTVLQLLSSAEVENTADSSFYASSITTIVSSTAATTINTNNQ